MINKVLSQLGLADNEAAVYLKLLQVGRAGASVLAYQLKLPRTTVQNILLRLETEEMVKRTIEKNTAVYVSVHPEELLLLVEMKKRKRSREFDALASDLKKIVPEMIGMIKGNINVPNVRFYRGEEGVRKVLWDTLTSKTELKDFANIDAMFKYVKEINDEYVAEREKTKVTKRSLLLDTPFAREVYSGGYSSKSHKGYKWISRDLYPFSIEMNIYDGKVSYLTYVENDLIGVIIENEHIYKMHDSMWNFVWDHS